MDSETKFFGAVALFWAVSAIATLAFWGFIGWLAYLVVMHFVG